MEGDVFQGMIFWWHAAMLLRPSSKVVRVTIENDKAAGVDDISIHYALPGIVAIFAHLPAAVRKHVHGWIPRALLSGGV